MLLRPCLIALATIALMTSRAQAHEFWIEPETYQVQSGAPLVAHFRNGQNFKGSSLAFFSKRSLRLDLVGQDVSTPFEGRMGDVPAVQATAPGAGLLVIVHQTAPSTLTYETWEKFQKFADHKDFPDIRERHLARGLPDSGFSERYHRFVKALVAVDKGAGSDTVVGLETEFVALANPYTDDTTAGLPVLLLYRDAPRGDAQVEVFDRAPDGTVTVRMLRTGDDGRVVVPVRSGHSYLLDAVILRALDDGGEEVWESLWAGMTFAVP
jgi:hypothetical protein